MADPRDGSLLTLVLMKVKVGHDPSEWIAQIEDFGISETAKSIADPSYICLSQYWKAARYYRERYGIDNNSFGGTKE
jgi:hypothetical protein